MGIGKNVIGGRIFWGLSMMGIQEVGIPPFAKGSLCYPESSSTILYHPPPSMKKLLTRSYK